MARHYQANEFIYDGVTPDPIDVAIDKKISMLYEMCILHKTKNSSDIREGMLRKVLSECNSERALTVAMHDVVFGNISLDTFLQRKGLMKHEA